ncbi:LytR/AlgR family response regulator transcription factor [Pinirhizobacter soli]|uniref:LytR/AlgR family response regulator transcription factor n=1 Tax=Pinirhizobacter soli TaxID=2786953 RepID=UPI00202A630D|nr:LytTR family DNA-binding domain-containing protein [Pinirhizobacter soli]
MKQRHFDLLAIAGVFVGYSITIRLALQLDVRESLLGGVANTIPVVIFGAMVRRIILGKLMGKPAAIQLLAHLPLCAAFSTLSYGLLIVLLGLFNGGGPSGFLVKPFSPGGLAWQSLENVTTYALIAAMSYLQAQRGRHDTAPLTPSLAAPAPGAAELTPQPEDAPWHAPSGDTRADPELSRYFVRIGDELRPIDMDTVVSIAGADDYAEVQTLSGKHLVRMTLADFTRSLDPAKYARVHRSWIVNVDRIARAEPAGGGRLLLHMETGQTISTSRTGARLLRDRVI